MMNTQHSPPPYDHNKSLKVKELRLNLKALHIYFTLLVIASVILAILTQI